MPEPPQQFMVRLLLCNYNWNTQRCYFSFEATFIKEMRLSYSSSGYLHPQGFQHSQFGTEVLSPSATGARPPVNEAVSAAAPEPAVKGPLPPEHQVIQDILNDIRNRCLLVVQNQVRVGMSCILSIPGRMLFFYTLTHIFAFYIAIL